MQRDDAQEVAARCPEDPAVEPPAELDGPERDEPGGLGRNVVSLDVDVVAVLVVHRLDRGDQPGKRSGQRGELLLAGHRVRRHAKRRRPERGSGGRLVAGNVDKQGRKPTAMDGTGVRQPGTTTVTCRPWRGRVNVGAGLYGRLMTAAAAERPPAVGLPRAYLVWRSGALVSQLGDAALSFGLGWAASAHGGPAAALVLTAVNLPQSVLLLAGGAVGDRLGARRVMIAGDSVMLAIAAVLALVSWRWGTPLALLAAAGLIIGTVNAFYLPSSGSMPRQLVGDEQLPRALALNQVGNGLVSMVGGPVGGALVGLAGFTAASAADSVSFAAVLAALIAVRPRFTPLDGPRRSVLRESADGISVALKTPGLAALLLLVGGVAGFVIPVTSLLVPLIARQHHWTATFAGLIVGAQAAGGTAVAAVVTRRGSPPRPGSRPRSPWRSSPQAN